MIKIKNIKEKSSEEKTLKLIYNFNPVVFANRVLEYLVNSII